MAGRGLAKASLGKACKRTPTDHWKKLFRIRDQTSEFASGLVPKLTDFISRINWNYYRATMRLEFIRLVDEIDRRYQVLTKTLETDIKTLSKEHATAAKSSSALVKPDANGPAYQSQRLIKAYEEEKLRLSEMKPYKDMPIGEYCVLRPDKALFVPHQGKSLFWPHTPDDQKPGPVGTPQLEEDPGELFVFGGDIGEASTVKPFAGRATPTMPIKVIAAEAERIEKRLAILKASKPTDSTSGEDKTGEPKSGEPEAAEAKPGSPDDDKEKQSRESEVQHLETTLASLRQAMTEAQREEQMRAHEVAKLSEMLPNDVQGIKARLEELRAKAAVESLDRPKELHSEEVELSVVKPQNAEIALLEAKLAEMTAAAAVKEDSAPLPTTPTVYRALSSAKPVAAQVGEMKPAIIEGAGDGGAGNVDVGTRDATAPKKPPQKPIVLRSVKPAHLMSVHTELEELETGEVKAAALQPHEKKFFEAKLRNEPLPDELRSAETHPSESLDTGEVRAAEVQPHEMNFNEPATKPAAEKAEAEIVESLQPAVEPTLLTADHLKSMLTSSEAKVVKADKCEVTISTESEADSDKISSNIVKCTAAQFASMPVKIDELTIEAKMIAVKLADSPHAVAQPTEAESAESETSAAIETAATEKVEAVHAVAAPAEAVHAETAPSEAASTETAPAEAVSAEAMSAEAKSNEAAVPAPFEIVTIEIETIETEPIEIVDQIKSKPADSKESSTESPTTICAEADSLPAQHDEMSIEAKMMAVRLAETKPAETESVASESSAIEQAERAASERADSETAKSEQPHADSAETDTCDSKSEKQPSNENKSEGETESTPNKNR